MPVFQIYVEKKPEFAVEAKSVFTDVKTALKIESLKSMRVLNRYFAQNLAEEDFEAAKNGIFSESQVDNVYATMPDASGCAVFAVEYLPGQFDQRADSCAQCISLATGKERPVIRTARVFLLEGAFSPDELARIKAYLINPVESRETGLSVPEMLDMPYDAPKPVKTLTGFAALDDAGLSAFLNEYALAMDIDDLRFCRDYFAQESRDPTITEIRVIDTYWSDHCRHTTFLTEIASADIESGHMKSAWDKYMELREKLYAGKNKPVTLMDIATIGAKALKAQGYLKELDESPEINACSVKITVDVDGTDEDWLLMFKNETHNHPTEIEPFGGAATCLGGAIRDPLSGRSYVYQAMRVTGAGDPLSSSTLPGKLPQRKLVQTAAAGYSSYGNQIGLATGHVREIYHPGYVAKRMEIGAVLGAAPAKNVRREEPAPGDLVILLGGRTGRDGCGGATGSSKSHTSDSLSTCGAEVQKGNAPEERKLQRLFRDAQATRLIKRCNDFGAGGVCVSIGELADGLRINLDAVPKKYEGLDGTELAISESQERMSVVVAAKDADTFIALADSENLEATVVAEITESPRLLMDWGGETIVNLSREFLNSNGAPKRTAIHIPCPDADFETEAPLTARDIKDMQADLRFCSQKGLVERFDSTIGAGTVLMPFGGGCQLTPTQAMAAKIPVLGGETTSCSLMAWGFTPEIAEKSPFHGGGAAVIESVAKIIAAGGSRKRCWLSFQEYFPRVNDDPSRWGMPAAALLGALSAQLGLKVAAIGGKDSMSGSFEALDVPPTLVSFAVSTANTEAVISPEFKQPGSFVYMLTPKYSEDKTADYADIVRLFDLVEELIAAGKIRAAWAVGAGGTADAVVKMCYGNKIGFRAARPLTALPVIGAFIIESGELPELADCLLGETTAEYALTLSTGESADLNEIQAAWEQTLEPVFPRNITQTIEGIIDDTSAPEPAHRRYAAKAKIAKPRVLIPVFPGTNCEYDTARAFSRAGGKADIFVVRNLTAAAISQSVTEFVKRAKNAQIIALPGGFSGGDEPDGSAKFITAFFKNPRVSETVMELLKNRDGLMCGICNGFQALIKLGLITTGEICEMGPDSPTLTYNVIGRHQSMLVRVKIASNRSPWLQKYPVGSIFTVPVSHGEGRFIGSGSELSLLRENGQIATVYVDETGAPSADISYNPNGSLGAVEGIFSPDGRVFGKMGHAERYGSGLYKNVPGETFMDMFGGAVDYYG